MRVGGGGEGRPSVIPELNFDPSLQLRIVERMVFVQILLRIEGREPLDLTEEVYTAGERKRGKTYAVWYHFAEIIHHAGKMFAGVSSTKNSSPVV